MMRLFSFRYANWGAGVALSVWVGGCVGPVQGPAPVVVPRPLPAPAVPAAATDWHDMPATPGVWRWQREGGLSTARFGEAGQPVRFSLVCDPATATISLVRSGVGGGAATMAILTTSLSAKLAARAGADGAIVATLPAREPLFDAMAYSRGRFAVQVAGAATLYLPSWPEVGRVVEDCRARGG